MLAWFDRLTIERKLAVWAWAFLAVPVVFFVDPELPAAVTTITLSYTLFDVTDRQDAGVAAVN